MSQLSVVSSWRPHLLSANLCLSYWSADSSMRWPFEEASQSKCPRFYFHLSRLWTSQVNFSRQLGLPGGCVGNYVYTNQRRTSHRPNPLTRSTYRLANGWKTLLKERECLQFHGKLTRWCARHGWCSGKRHWWRTGKFLSQGIGTKTDTGQRRTQTNARSRCLSKTSFPTLLVFYLLFSIHEQHGLHCQHLSQGGTRHWALPLQASSCLDC